MDTTYRWPDSPLTHAAQDAAVRVLPATYPREGFKAYITRAWAAEAARVPQGRAKLLRRYGAFSAAVALAAFDE
jgi:hypothetical protein